MSQVKRIVIAIISMPYLLYGWGDGDKLSGGGCAFDKETGYSGTVLYSKEDEAYVIVDITDSRYGTTSTVYNAKTCEKVTSGQKSESNFGKIMRNKGMTETDLDSSTTYLEASLYHIIQFSDKRSDIIVKVIPVGDETRRELQQILNSLETGSKPLYQLSSRAKKLIRYKGFNQLIENKVKRTSAGRINYEYAFWLSGMVKNTYLTRALRKSFFKSFVHSVKDIPKWYKLMAKYHQGKGIPQLYIEMTKLHDFGQNLNFSNFLSSIEYK